MGVGDARAFVVEWSLAHTMHYVRLAFHLHISEDKKPNRVKSVIPGIWGGRVVL